MHRLQSIKNEIDRVNLEIQSAERDYDLNRAAELKYGTVLQLQKQLKEAEEALEKEAVSRPSIPVLLIELEIWHHALILHLNELIGQIPLLAHRTMQSVTLPPQRRLHSGPSFGAARKLMGKVRPGKGNTTALPGRADCIARAPLPMLRQPCPPCAGRVRRAAAAGGGDRGRHRRHHQPLDRHPRQQAGRQRAREAAAPRRRAAPPRHRPGRGCGGGCRRHPEVRAQ